MAYQEGEQSRLRRLNSREAISLAVQGQWREAIKINKTILDVFPTDIEALNRMGRAHMELGEYGDAETAYKRALEVDAYNAIAQKNLQRLAILKKARAGKQPEVRKLEPQVFVEEIGKAGVVNLQALAKPEVLARVVAGDPVKLKITGNNLVITSETGDYLGVVDTKHGLRLIRLTKNGNKYSGAIVSSAERSVSVIIRETFQHAKNIGQMSFPTRGVEGVRTDIQDRVIRREIEQEESLNGEAGYTVVGSGGEENEALPEEPVMDDYDQDEES